MTTAPTKPGVRVPLVRYPVRSSIACALFFATFAATTSLQAQAGPPPIFFRAQAVLRGGDTSGALALLDGAARRDSLSARTWRALGNLNNQAGRPAAALSAYQTALRVDAGVTRAAAMYGIGVSWALQHNADSAFAWLQRAASLRTLDMSQAAVDGQLDALHADPRYATLLPTPDAYAHAFAPSVKVIREWDGESANDQFGWIARSVGDVDGDGVSDVVTSAPTRGSAAAPAGKVYLYSTRTGRLLWSHDGKPGDQLGLGVEGAGDANHDGIPDVVASAPGAHAAYIYSGRDGAVLQTFTAPDTNEAFGIHVAAAGDVDGDGYADVIVGSPDNRPNGGPGHAYIYSGKTGALLQTLAGERGGDAFGSAVAGSIDAQHRVTLIVGAPGAGARHTGRTYVYDGHATTPRFTTESDSTGAALGAMFLSIPGDFDGDGVADVYSSDYSNSARGPATGRVYVYSGATGKPLLTLTGPKGGIGFGTSPSMAGDVNHDGLADLIVGAWQYGDSVISGGGAFLYSGKDGQLLATFSDLTPGDTFGFDAVGIGDVDGDGTVDLLITAAWSGVHGFHSGRIFIVSSGVKKR
jgi:hypothetical protein